MGNGFTSFVGVLWSRRWFLFFLAAETLEPKHSTCFGFAHLACGRLYSTLQFKKMQRLNFDFLAEHPKVKVEMNGFWLPTARFFSPNAGRGYASSRSVNCSRDFRSFICFSLHVFCRKDSLISWNFHEFYRFSSHFDWDRVSFNGDTSPSCILKKMRCF